MTDQINRLLCSPIVAITVAVASGFAFGFAAWGEGRAPSLVILFPLLVAVLPRRLLSGAFAFGYVLALLRALPEFASSWFENDTLVGWLITVGYAITSGFVWSMGWGPANDSANTLFGRQMYRVGGMSLAWLMSLIPPFAIFVPGHPVIGWGYVTPGTGWFGVAASLFVPMLLVVGWSNFNDQTGARFGTLAVLTVALGMHGLNTPPQIASAFDSTAAVSTNWGKTSTIEAGLQNIERIGAFVRTNDINGSSTFIWPESILGVYDHALSSVLNIEVLKPAKERNETQIIGMDLLGQDGKYKSIAVAYYPDGRTAVAQSRQPVPVALWRPWAKASYVSDWHASNHLTLANGQQISIIFCYEEYIPGLFLLSQAMDKPDFYAAMSNTWASTGTTAASIQTAHSAGIARLFGVSLVKAENRPIAQ